MKLSEAITLGIGLVKEDRHTFGYIDTSGQCHGCAVTTALAAIGEFVGFDTDATKYLHRSSRLAEFWPWTAHTSENMKYCSIFLEISHRHWRGESRESIAKWIATIEPQENIEVIKVEANEVSRV